jgi:hypothetical protein
LMLRTLSWPERISWIAWIWSTWLVVSLLERARALRRRRLVLVANVA